MSLASGRPPAVADLDREIAQQIDRLRADYVCDALARIVAARQAHAQAADSGEAGDFAWRQIADVAHTMKGQGSTFDYPLVTEIADLLCRYVRKTSHPPGETAFLIAAACLDALDVILKEGMRGGGNGPGRSIVARLRRLSSVA